MTTPEDLTLPSGQYRAYLIRLWQESTQTPWRASTQCVQTGEKHFFGDMAALHAFLVEQTTKSQA